MTTQSTIINKECKHLTHQLKDNEKIIHNNQQTMNKHIHIIQEIMK